MTKTFQQHSIDELSKIILDLISLYSTNKSKEVLHNLIKSVILIVPKIRTTVLRLTNKPYEEFDDDISLDFIQFVISNRDIGDPVFKIRSLINYRLDKAKRVKNKQSLNLLNTNEEKNFYNYTFKDRFKLEDTINKTLYGLSDSLKISIIYYVKYPELLLKYTSSTNDINKYIIVCKTFEILRTLMKNESTINISFSSNRIADLLRLSGIYNLSPACFVLLNLLGDFRKFIQFIMLFENTSIHIPKLSDLSDVISTSNEISDKFNDGNLSIKDRENLSTLVTNVKLEDIDTNTELSPFINEFIAKIVETSNKSYEKLHDKLIKNLDYSNPDKIRKIYEILNKEHKSSIRLFAEIVSSLATVEDIRKIIKEIRK